MQMNKTNINLVCDNIVILHYTNIKMSRYFPNVTISYKSFLSVSLQKVYCT